MSSLAAPAPVPVEFGSMAPLLSVSSLHASVDTPRGTVRAVDGVSFELARGEAMGLVGESGSGKSFLVKALMGLAPRRTNFRGEVSFEGSNLLELKPKAMRDIWGPQMAMIFQDPNRSLNPVLTVGLQITEGMRRHLGIGRSEARGRALSLLREVGVPDPETRLSNYPHELSGGMRQRVMIAIALSCDPKLLIADEPTTALDVTVQRQILDLLHEVQVKYSMSLILISHDLSLVSGRTDTTAVMYAGRLVEKGQTRDVFEHPQHWYTKALLGATPSLSHQKHTRFRSIDGSPPDLSQPLPGCGFAPRCRHARPECISPGPVEVVVSPRHVAWCLDAVGTSQTKEKS